VGPDEAVEDVAAKRTRFDVGVVEVVVGVARHPELLHHTPGTGIGRDGHRDDLVKPNLTEAELDTRSRRLGGIAAAPVLAGQPPPDLDRRGEVGLEITLGQADEADERRSVENLDATDDFDPAEHLDRPQPPSALIDPVGDVACLRVAALPSVGRGEVAHDLGIGVHRCERLEVLRPPLAQQQPLGAQLGHP
jgi:hypothetical protein